MTSEKHGLDLDHSYAIVISNANKTVPFMRQANSTDIDGRVVWDYHVIFLSANTGHADGPFIYDLDSTLAFPCPSLRYLLETCSPQSKCVSSFKESKSFGPSSRPSVQWSTTTGFTTTPAELSRLQPLTIRCSFIPPSFAGGPRSTSTVFELCQLVTFSPRSPRIVRIWFARTASSSRRHQFTHQFRSVHSEWHFLQLNSNMLSS